MNVNPLSDAFTFTTNHITSESIPHVLTNKQLPSGFIRNEVNQFADKANNLANQLLAPKNTTYKGPIIIRNHYYYESPFYTPWFYSRPRPVIYFDNSGHRRDQDNKGGSILLGVIATIGMFIASYAVGSAIASHNDAGQELDETRDTQQRFSSYKSYTGAQEQPLLREATYAARLKERICSRIKNSSAWDLALRVALTVGLALTAIGAFTAASPLMGLGVILSICSLTALLFKWGFESMDKSNTRDAQALRDSLYKLKLIE